MKIDKNGNIAYHSYQIREDGFYFVQYDFDGEIEEERLEHSYGGEKNIMDIKKL